MAVLTTHTGSLPRADAGVDEVLAHQLEVGLDVVNDGEVGKESYATYVVDRLSGFGESGEAFLGRGRADLADYPRYRDSLTVLSAATGAPPVCVGPVAYQGRPALTAQLRALAKALASARSTRHADVFVTAASPGVISRFMPNRHYPDEESYLLALAEAMKTEYDAITDAGFLLQLDCPDLTAGWHARDGDLDAHRRDVARRLEILDHATRDIEPDRMRLHVCWGNYEGPHHHDLELRHLVDLLLAARPAGLSFEGANPRHEHEWTVFAEVDVPDDTILVPGVIDTTTNYIEHPELVAQRIRHYVDAVGGPRVVAGTDCGFATFAAAPSVDPDIAWAKLASLVEGAARVS